MKKAFLIPLLLFVFGCGSSKHAIVETPVPQDSVQVVPLIPDTLAGIYPITINDVLDTFHNTFVPFEHEVESETNFMAGIELFQEIDSTLNAPHNVDTTGFAEEYAQGEEAIRMAASSDAPDNLLAEAQMYFENALELNPLHEDAKYQLAQIYKIRASTYRQAEDYEKTVELLKNILLLRQDDHNLWAELAFALEENDDFEESAVIWLRAAETVLDDYYFHFPVEEESPPQDSLTLFTYYVKSYQAFIVNQRRRRGSPCD